MDKHEGRDVAAIEREGLRVEYRDDETGDTAVDVNPIESQWRRLDEAAERLVNTITAVHDRFMPVLREEVHADALAVKRDSGLRGSSTYAERYASHADLIERQVDRLHELLARCEL